MVLADYWQMTELTSTTVAPGAGVKVRYGLGDLGTEGEVFLFGGLFGAVQYNTVDGDWRTEVPQVEMQPRHQSFSESEFTFGGSASGGIGFASQGLTVKTKFRYGFEGNSPVLDFTDPTSTVDGTGGARVKFEDREESSSACR